MYSNTLYQDGEGQYGEFELNLNQDETVDENNVENKIVFDTNVIELVITETEQPQPTEEIVAEA
jgi:hypothetical protein